MGRAPCCDKANVNKGPWSPEEDGKLKEYIQKYGIGGNWIALPQKIGLRRCGKSCRLRWLNYLRPNIKHGDFTEEEDMIICSLYTTIGSRWSIIASHLQDRTDNDIKNYWNTKLKKKFFSMAFSSSSSSSQHIKKVPIFKDSFSNQTNCATSPLGGPIISYPSISISNGLSNFQSQKVISTNLLDPLIQCYDYIMDDNNNNNNVFMIKHEEIWSNQKYHIAPNDIFQDGGAQKLIFNDYGINYNSGGNNVNHQWSDDNTYYKETVANDQCSRLSSMWNPQSCQHELEKAIGYAFSNPNVALGYDADPEETRQQLMNTSNGDINGIGCYDNTTQQEEKAMYCYY